jgi:hypothetical protein
MTWTQVDHLNQTEFMEYIETLSDDDKQKEIKKYSKRLLKNEMKKYISFYNFIKNYSPRDFKIIKGSPHVSQRVLYKHVKYWNEIHPNNSIKKLQIFFY